LHKELDMEKLKNIGVDLVEKHFPKGKCKERGHAIVLYAELIIAFEREYKAGNLFKKESLLDLVTVYKGKIPLKKLLRRPI